MHPANPSFHVKRTLFGAVLHDGGGGGGGDSEVTSEPWSGVQPYLLEAYQKGGELFSQPQEFFPDQTYIGFSPETEQALGLTAERARQGSGLSAAAQGRLGSMLTGAPLQGAPGAATLQEIAANQATPGSRMVTQGAGAVNPALANMRTTAGGEYTRAGNPYMQALTEDVASQVLPQVQAAFGGAGRSGDSPLAQQAAATGMTRALAPALFGQYGQERQLQEQAARSLGGLAESGYGRRMAGGQAMSDIYNQMMGRRAGAAGTLGGLAGQERGQLLGGIGMAPELALSDYGDFSRLAEVGRTREEQAGKELAERMARWEFSQEEPWQRTSRFLNLLGGGGPWGTTTTVGGGGSPLMGALGLGLTGAGVAGGLGWSPFGP